MPTADSWANNTANDSISKAAAQPVDAMAPAGCSHFNVSMDEATRRHWEQIADRCFDRAYRTVLRQVTPKPANG